MVGHCDRQKIRNNRRACFENSRVANPDRRQDTRESQRRKEDRYQIYIKVLPRQGRPRKPEGELTRVPRPSLTALQKLGTELLKQRVAGFGRT